MSEPIIRVHGLVKTFPLARAPLTLFRQMQQRAQSTREEQVLYALRDLEFEIRRGEWIGIVGNNGSGKTTLLKVIAGLYAPTRGTLRVNGNVTLLSGLGVGMIGELTVRDNVFLYGALHGIPTRQLKEQFAEMIAWAELQAFAYAKFQTLSSGMRSRLAFSVSRYAQSAIHLQDEALTAGDKDFADKCYAFYEAARTSGRTWLIAAHDLHFIERFCARTLWLVKGQQELFGETAEVLARYRAYHA